MLDMETKSGIRALILPNFVSHSRWSLLSLHVIDLTHVSVSGNVYWEVHTFVLYHPACGTCMCVCVCVLIHRDTNCRVASHLKAIATVCFLTIDADFFFFFFSRNVFCLVFYFSSTCPLISCFLNFLFSWARWWYIYAPSLQICFIP